MCRSARPPEDAEDQDGLRPCPDCGVLHTVEDRIVYVSQLRGPAFGCNRNTVDFGGHTYFRIGGEVLHVEAFGFVERLCAERFATFDGLTVVEYGSLDINGSVRGLFPGSRYHGIDLQAGPGVDEVADAISWRASAPADVVVCCEVLEHSPEPGGIVSSAAANLRSGGWLIVTCATDTRAGHSAVDGGPLRDGEHYGNIDPVSLGRALRTCGFTIEELHVHRGRGDLYAAARRD
jgi:hypothetical protein